MFHFISVLYHESVYRPLLNLLIFFYNVIPGHDIGVVIILLTVLIRLALAPSFHKSLKSQKAMNDLQPKLTELREKHKGNKEAEAKAMMDLYKEHKINPFASCLPLLIQLPLLLALNQVFRAALGTGQIEGLYTFVKAPEHISFMFLHFLDLSKIPWVGSVWYWPGVVLAVLTGLSQFWQSKLMLTTAKGPVDATAKIMQMQMTYFFPVFFVYLSLRFVTGLSLYWTATTVFTIAQQYWILKTGKDGITPGARVMASGHIWSKNEEKNTK